MSRPGTLLLDHSFFPIQFIDWKKAMSLFLTNRAEVIEMHHDVKIKSIRKSYQLPKVLRLFSIFTKKTHIRFSRHNIFLRDKGKCQYCGILMKSSEFTLDHVLPRSRGGASSWENLVTCCHKCNGKKGDKTPDEAGMILLKKPTALKWTPALVLRVHESEWDKWKVWLAWAYKDKTG